MRPKTAIQPQGPLMYTLDLGLGTIEELEQGRCPEALANYAHELLRWRREAIRATAPAKRYDD